jgi:hypothetical protein
MRLAMACSVRCPRTTHDSMRETVFTLVAVCVCFRDCIVFDLLTGDLLSTAQWQRCVLWCDVMPVHVSCRLLNLINNQLSSSIPLTLGSLSALM